MAEAGAPGSPDSGQSGDHNAQSSAVRDQDRFLPIANISRIMKKAIPANGKIAKDAKECVQHCVSEFIAFVTSEASDKCNREKRKTINGEDLLWAITTLGFEDYIEPLKIYLHLYRKMEEGQRGVDQAGWNDGGKMNVDQTLRRDGGTMTMEQAGWQDSGGVDVDQGGWDDGGGHGGDPGSFDPGSFDPGMDYM